MPENNDKKLECIKPKNLIIIQKLLRKKFSQKEAQLIYERIIRKATKLIISKKNWIN